MHLLSCKETGSFCWKSSRPSLTNGPTLMGLNFKSRPSPMVQEHHLKSTNQQALFCKKIHTTLFAQKPIPFLREGSSPPPSYLSRSPDLQSPQIITIYDGRQPVFLLSHYLQVRTRPYPSPIHTYFSTLSVAPNPPSPSDISLPISVLCRNSPSGKLVQIEHALMAVGSGQTSLGIKGNDFHLPHIL